MTMLLLSDMGVDWSTPTINSVVSQALNWTIVIAGFLVSTFMAVKFAWEYFKMSTQGADLNWDWNELLRVMFLLLIIGSYAPLAIGVTEAFRSINHITQVNSDMNNELRNEANKYYIKRVKVEGNEKLQKINTLIENETDSKRRAVMIDFKNKHLMKTSENFAKADGTPLGAETSDIEVMKENAENLSGMNGLGDMGSGMIVSMFNSLTHFLAVIVKWIIGTFVKVIFQIGIVLGPIVLAFGVFFREKPVQYMNQMLTLGLVFTTLNILDMLMLSFAKHAMVNPSVGEAVAFDLAMIGAYLSAFKLTNLFVGATGINSLMGRGLGVAAGGAAAVIGGVAMLSSGGASGSGGGSPLASVARTTSAGVQQVSKQRLD